MLYTGSGMRPILAWISGHRRRIARILFAAGLLAVVLQLGPHVPQETALEFALGDDHAQVVELRVGFEREGEELHGVSLGFPKGAPATVRHTLNLPAGEYVLYCELRQRGGGSRQLIRRMTAPADGIVRIDLIGGLT